jgi:DNA-binding response OmpR family regulator
VKPITILYIEDDPYLGLIVRELLESQNFKVLFFKNAEEGLKQFLKTPTDLCLLDVMLPGMDGFELGRKIRSVDKEVPVLYLTAKSQKEDVIEGFTLGADDYLKKPFSMEELVLRIRVLLRRTHNITQQKQEKTVYEFSRYQFFYRKKQLLYDGQIHELTHKECELLRLFLENPNQLVEREIMLQKIWGDDHYFNARSMDVFIARLRRHFKSDPSVEIVNIRGIGFKLLVEL